MKQPKMLKFSIKRFYWLLQYWNKYSHAHIRLVFQIYMTIKPFWILTQRKLVRENISCNHKSQHIVWWINETTYYGSKGLYVRTLQNKKKAIMPSLKRSSRSDPHQSCLLLLSSNSSYCYLLATYVLELWSCQIYHSFLPAVGKMYLKNSVVKINQSTRK